MERNQNPPEEKLKPADQDINPEIASGERFFQIAWERLVEFGFGTAVIRAVTLLMTVLVILAVTFLLGKYYVSVRGGSAMELSTGLIDAVTPTPMVALPPLLPDAVEEEEGGIAREASLLTILPQRKRTTLITYVIQAGDSLFSVADKFNLKPESLLWANRYTLGDDPHTIFPGQELYILPVDGTLHRWSAGEGLNSVAEYYQVTPEEIILYPANGLSLETIGDYSSPNISPDTLLIIPGGKGEYSDWRTPRITRGDPATAQYVGPGACSGSYDGIMGTLLFTWPVESKTLSGYDYEPAANHFGIDIGGKIGTPVMSADNGVVVYAGWNDWGYGEMVVIDHGLGWQTLYAHLSTVEVICGQEVYRGDVIGKMGDTGNAIGAHLHFELRSDKYGRVNPWDFLQ